MRNRFWLLSRVVALSHSSRLGYCIYTFHIYWISPESKTWSRATLRRGEKGAKAKRRRVDAGRKNHKTFDTTNKLSSSSRLRWTVSSCCYGVSKPLIVVDALKDHWWLIREWNMKIKYYYIFSTSRREMLLKRIESDEIIVNNK